MADLTRVYINRTRITARGALYEARLDSPFGPVLVGTSAEPMLSACRALVAIGKSGPVEIWDSKRPFPRMCGDIRQLAKLTVDEARRTFRRWQPFPLRGYGEISADHAAGVSDSPETETPVLDGIRA